MSKSSIVSPGNLNSMGGVGLGSFAHVGRRTISEVPSFRQNIYLAVEIGEVCQLKCKHCIYHNEDPLTARPNPQIDEWLDRTLEGGLDPIWVSFAGKEPSLFPQELILMATKTKRPDRVNILMSNGLKLMPPLIQQLAPLIDCFDISLDGDKAAHEWMRGENSFDRIWNRLGDILCNSDSLVGIISTAVHATLPDGRTQWQGIVRLAHQLRDEFPFAERLSLSISLYYGHPTDPLLLRPEDLTAILAELNTVDFPIRVLWTANYAHLLPTVLRQLNWDLSNLEYDADTGLPILRYGNLLLILFNLSPVQQQAFRIANDGSIYLGCNHLSLGEKANQYSLGTLETIDFADKTGDSRTASTALQAAPRTTCGSCADWLVCRGGDVQSGTYFRGRAQDPYCPLLNPEAA
ncbi:MAG: radical SAM protein [Candidatus Thiodiazotropha taylori]